LYAYGKTTLLHIIAGLDREYEGKIKFDGNWEIGYLPQDPQLDETKAVRRW